MKVARGTILLLDLDPTRGHEQHGLRPCVAVSDPEIAADQRFPLVAVVPLTRTPGVGALYPGLRPGPSGLKAPSFALIDHLRSVDKRRIRRAYGPVAPDEMAAITEGLVLFLGLPREHGSRPGDQPAGPRVTL